MNPYEKRELQKAIKAINGSIASNRIYLFGSNAEGNPNKHSDLDLCILTKTLNERKVEAIRRVRRSLAKEVSIPIDLLLYTSDEFKQRADISSTLEYKILHEGVLVYGS